MENLKLVLDTAAVAAAVVTILSLISALYATARMLVRIPAEIRAFFFRPKLILVPTPDDLAKFGAQAADTYVPTEEELREEQRGEARRKVGRIQNDRKSRILVIGLFFAAGYIIVFYRLIHFGFLNSDGTESADGRTTLLVIFACLLALYPNRFFWNALRRYWKDQ